MAEVTAVAVKALREKTGAGMMECKKALVEANGNEERANEILRERGLASAKKKEGRVAAEGVVGSYIHMGGKVGVLVEVNCETDFVARGEEFQQLVKDIAMHIAAAEPRYVARDEVSSEVLDKEREIARAQAKNDPKNANKPEQVLDKIVEGRLNKFYEEFVLLDQPFIKEPAQTVGEMVTEKVAKTGEKITIRRFARYKMGEGLSKREDDFQDEVAKLAGN
ncbi:MAG TPA: translation elongation factor Ts [Pyrinomonadaceae bacterium]|jgi:elongation factor Ts|nr:translation elongation factor Ts [Pyrinomonadaceae bacterium]